MDYWRNKMVKGFIIKLGSEKAFDKINWKFMDYMLLNFYFLLARENGFIGAYLVFSTLY